LATLRCARQRKSRRDRPRRTAPPIQKARCRMNESDQHDGERELRDRERRGSEKAKSSARLVPVKGSGLSGPFIRRPVMTMLLTLSVIVAGLATYGKLAVNDLPAVDYPVIP